MKTQQLIELQRSITQGEWQATGGQTSYYPVAVASNPKCRTIAIFHDWDDDKDANARAIALVPELLAEVIRLREQLEESTALNENFASVSDPETLCHLSEYRAVIKQCRALLADAK